MFWLIALLLLSIPAYGQSPAVRAVLFGGPSYQGPQDAIRAAPKVFYGIRALSASVAGLHSKAINVRRNSDNATKDIFLLPNGSLDQASASAFGTGTTLFVTEFYDQSGNGFNATQNTAASQCGLVLYSANAGTLPRVTCAGSQSYAMVTLGALVQPWTEVAVVTNTAAVFGEVLDTHANNKPFLGISSNGSFSQTYCQYTANVQSPNFVTFNAMSVIECVINGASSVANGNGAETSGTTGTAGNSDTDWELIGTALPLTGDMEEAGIWLSAFSATQRSTMCHNMWNYWKTQTPC